MADAKSITMPAGQKALTHLAVPSEPPPVDAMLASSASPSEAAPNMPLYIQPVPSGIRESTISRAFAALLPILAGYIRAERDLEDIGFSLDPAYSAWHRESDRFQDRLIDMLRVLRSAPIGVSMDVPLRRMALLVHVMRCEQARARALHQKMDAAFDLHFRVPGKGPMARHRTLMLSWCRPHVANLATLPLFDPDPKAGDDPGLLLLID